MAKLILLALVLVSLGAWARPLTEQQKLADLNELMGHVRAGYGPLHFKRDRLGIDAEEVYQRYLPLVRETKSNAEFYYLMIRFVAEFNDSHFRANLPIDFETFLGFTTDLVQDKVVIDTIDRAVLPESIFPFAKGDEIVSLGDKTASELLEELVPYMGQGFELAARRRASWMIPNRRANKVPAQFGKVLVEVRRGDSKVTEKVELEWKEKGSFMDEAVRPKRVASFSLPTTDYDKLELAEERFRCSGESRIKMPAGATDIMRSNCAPGRACNPPFVAYYYPTPKGNVGYLRIPHYSPTEPNPTVNAAQLRLAQYEFAVRELEKNTVGLIIDQDHNCGGSVLWLHQFMTLFMDKPFAPMQFELLATKASLVDFSGWLRSQSEHTVNFQNNQRVVNLIRETWLGGTDFLTRQTSIFGEDLWYPNSIRYTKPIIVLINELSGSGGDAFPAMMQGYGRAKLLGTRTVGAGGHVTNLPPLNNSQLQVAITRSLFYRPDGVAVENNGAEPDIPYTPTLNDFKFGYQEYQQFYTAELLKLL